MGQAQKRGRSFELTVMALALVGLSVSPASSQQLTDFPVFHLEAHGSDGQGFAILNPRGTPHCLIVTVSHVAQPGEPVEVDGLRINADSLQPSPTHTTATYLDKLADGLIILLPTEDANLGDCAPLARLKNAEELLSSDRLGRLTYAERSGDLDTIKAFVDGDPRSAARLQISSVGGHPIEPGLSGSPYTIGGQLLGVATSVDHGGAELIRLDTAELNPRYIASPPPPPPAAPQWQPFDRSRLPKEYRDVSQAAYEIRQNAEAVVTAAESTAALVDEAVAAAKLGAAGYGSGNLTNTDRAYLGQVNTASDAAGYGEMRFLSGADIGDILKSYLISDGAHSYFTGAGKIIWGNPTAHNNRTIEWGVFNHSAKMLWYFDGPTKVEFQDGSFEYFIATEEAEKTFVSTYIRTSDGNIFENTKDADGFDDGPGVRWSADGQPLCICVWKHGNVVSQWVPTGGQ